MRKVSPCYDCGHDPLALAELARGEYEYLRVLIFGQEIVLCGFCDADFDSYHADYLGAPEESENNYPMKLIAKVGNPCAEEDG